MHVLILNQYALPAGSAGITRHGDLAAQLVRRGHQVTVIASNYDYLLRQPGKHVSQSEVTDDGVRFIWLETGSYSANDRNRVRSILQYTWKAAWAAARVRPRPDIVVASSPHPLAGLSGIAAAFARRLPWVFEVRDFWPSALLDLGAVQAGSLTHRALSLVERISYAASARVVVVPPRGHLRLEELGFDGSKAIHIPNGTGLTKPPGELPETLAAALRDLNGKFLIAYTGAIGVPQSFESAIQGMARLAKDGGRASDAVLLLIGSGVRRDALRQVVHHLKLQNVIFHGPVDKPAVAAVLARSDACLVQLGALDNFRYGLSPNKLFDYMGAGKPVLIAADYPTVVDEENAGIRFRPGDADAFADAVLRLMHTPEAERVAMGERGRALVRARYSVQAIADQYERLLEDVVGHRR